MLQSYQQAKKLVITSNEPPVNIALQIAESVDNGLGSVNKALAVLERMKQTWQTVEFTGPSYRDNQPKWWRNVERPPTMPRSLEELAAQARNSADFPRILGAAILEIARTIGAEGQSLEELARLLDPHSHP